MIAIYIIKPNYRKFFRINSALLGRLVDNLLLMLVPTRK